MKTSEIVQKPLKTFITLLNNENYVLAAKQLSSAFRENGWTLDQKKYFLDQVLIEYNQHSRHKSASLKRPGPAIGRYQFWMDLGLETIDRWVHRISPLATTIQSFNDELNVAIQEHTQAQEDQKQATFEAALEEAHVLRGELSKLKEQEDLMQKLDKNQQVLSTLLGKVEKLDTEMAEVKALATTPPKPIAYCLTWQGGAAMAHPIEDTPPSSYATELSSDEDDARLRKRLATMLSSPLSSSHASPKQRRMSYPCSPRCSPR
jgi:hypothetical protein